MHDVQRDMINLIRSGLTGQKHPIRPDFSLEHALPFIAAHNLATLCYYGAIANEIDATSPAMKELFGTVCYHVYCNEQQMKLAKQIFALFDQEKIDYMPLKGILLKDLYPRPEMRVMGDIDVLIKTEQYKNIKPIMHQLSFQEFAESDHELIWSHNEFHVELHKRLIPSYNEDFYSYFGDGWQLAKKKSATLYAMTDEDMLIYLFTHFAKHYRDGGIGIKQTVDLWLFREKHLDLNEEYIRRELSKLKLCAFYDNVLKTLDVWFSDAPSSDVTDLITNVIFKSGVFGNKSSHVLSQEIRATARSGKSTSKAARLINLAFMPYSSMCIKYPFLKRVPILLPVMWVVRWIDILFFKRHRVKEKMHDFNLLEKDKVEAYRQELSAVGLSFNSGD